MCAPVETNEMKTEWHLQLNRTGPWCSWNDTASVLLCRMTKVFLLCWLFSHRSVFGHGREVSAGARCHFIDAAQRAESPVPPETQGPAWHQGRGQLLSASCGSVQRAPVLRSALQTFPLFSWHILQLKQPAAYSFQNLRTGMRSVCWHLRRTWMWQRRAPSERWVYNRSTSATGNGEESLFQCWDSVVWAALCVPADLRKRTSGVTFCPTTAALGPPTTPATECWPGWVLLLLSSQGAAASFTTEPEVNDCLGLKSEFDHVTSQVVSGQTTATCRRLNRLSLCLQRTGAGLYSGPEELTQSKTTSSN